MSITTLTMARATEALIERVYVAGPVLSGNGKGSLEVLTWRCEIFGVRPDSEFWELTANTHAGRFYYAGPTISACHGASDPGLAQSCLRELALADSPVRLDRPRRYRRFAGRDRCGVRAAQADLPRLLQQEHRRLLLLH